MADLIVSAFARIGDRRKPPTSDATGAVNMDNGYTPNYEIDLQSGDPLAKAVERDVMNYMFWMLTDNLMQYQRVGNPAWDGATPGGYSVGATVMVGSTAYRSTTNNNTTTPGSSTTWDEVWMPTRLRKIIPMPLGGDSYLLDGILSSGSDVFSLSDGFYIVQTDAIAATIANLPSGVNKAGVLEVKKFNNGGAASMMLRYNASNNRSYWLNYGPGSSNVWVDAIGSQDLGNTSGRIPRIAADGITITNPVESNFQFKAVSGAAGNYSRIYTDAAAPVGSMSTAVELMSFAAFTRIGILRAAGNSAGAVAWQIENTNRITIERQDFGPIVARTSNLNVFGPNSVVGLLGTDGTTTGALVSGIEGVRKTISLVAAGVGSFKVYDNGNAVSSGDVQANNIVSNSGVYLLDSDTGLKSSSAGRVDFLSNGTSIGNWDASGATFTTASATMRFRTPGVYGVGMLASQYTTEAPFYSVVGNVASSDNSYYPAVKGRVSRANGLGMAYSFGFVTPGSGDAAVTRGSMGIQGIDQAGAAYAWFFDMDGGTFRSPGDVQIGNGSFRGQGAIIAGDVNAVNASLSGSLTATSARFNGDIRLNRGVFDGGIATAGLDSTTTIAAAQGINAGTSITAATSLFVGNGTARFNPDGNISGPIWGGELQAYIQQRLLRDGATYAGFASNDVSRPYMRHEASGSVIILQQQNTASLNYQGWHRDTSTSVLMQWGVASAVFDDTPTDVMFNTAFPAWCLYYGVSLSRSTVSSDLTATMVCWGKANNQYSGRIVFQSNSNNGDMRAGDVTWFAIGY